MSQCHVQNAQVYKLHERQRGRKEKGPPIFCLMLLTSSPCLLSLILIISGKELGSLPASRLWSKCWGSTQYPLAGSSHYLSGNQAPSHSIHQAEKTRCGEATWALQHRVEFSTVLHCRDDTNIEEQQDDLHKEFHFLELMGVGYASPESAERRSPGVSSGEIPSAKARGSGTKPGVSLLAAGASS